MAHIRLHACPPPPVAKQLMCTGCAKMASPLMLTNNEALPLIKRRYLTRGVVGHEPQDVLAIPLVASCSAQDMVHFGIGCARWQRTRLDVGHNGGVVQHVGRRAVLHNGGDIVSEAGGARRRACHAICQNVVDRLKAWRAASTGRDGSGYGRPAAGERCLIADGNGDGEQRLHALCAHGAAGHLMAGTSLMRPCNGPDNPKNTQHSICMGLEVRVFVVNQTALLASQQPKTILYYWQRHDSHNDSNSRATSSPQLS